MNLYLIRHARQDSLLCNIDVKLAPEGVRQAELLAERLKNYPIELFYSSNLLRAVETAEILNTRKLEHRIRKELQEINFGKLTGKTNQENHNNYREFFKQRNELTEDLAFPEGECGLDVYHRAMPVLEEITAQKIEAVAIVTHGGTIRSLLTGILGLSQAKKLLFGVTLENSSITQLTWDKNYKRYTLERFNDSAHLEPYPELLRKSWR